MIHLMHRSSQKSSTKTRGSTVHEITGRKASKKGQIRANSLQDRITLWQDHFKFAGTTFCF